MIKLLNFLYNFLLIPFLNKYIIYKEGSKGINRSEIINNLYDQLSGLDNSNMRVWFHSASMGEFEQAKPVIEILKKRHNNIIVICTFFSPSGYENQKNYEFADFLSYLPMDTKELASEFVQKVNPDIAVFVRYDLWFNLINFAKIKGTKLYLINATIPSVYSSFVSKFIGNFLLQSYNKFDKVFCFNSDAYAFFKGLNLDSDIILSSDTRLDRIVDVVNQAKSSSLLPDKIINKEFLTLVVGSSWEEDEKLISKSLKLINDNGLSIRAIIVPHKPEPKNIERIKLLFEPYILYSEIENLQGEAEFYSNYHIIVDRMGVLLRLYNYADIAYVGCGFGDGVHSTAEPAGYGLPIITGPNIDNSPDALALNKLGALKIINNIEELNELLVKLLQYPYLRKEMSSKSLEYINNNTGSSEVIVEQIME